MSNYDIIYFSGTGNTQKCAEEICKKIQEKGEDATIHRIESGNEETFLAKNIIIGYPVHGFGTPGNILTFARRMPEGIGKAYIFKTSGEPLRLNDNSSATLIKILRKKGYDVRGEYHYIMPYNMIFRHSDDMATKMYLVAKERINKDVEEIVKGGRREKKILMRAKIAYIVSKIEHPGVKFNGRLFHIKKDRCIRCDLCVKNCPTNNIKYKDGKFRFGGDCILCSRCAFFCPKDAVRLGLMDILRVNGAYNFKGDPDKAKIGKYCRKSYYRYFNE